MGSLIAPLATANILLICETSNHFIIHITHMLSLIIINCVMNQNTYITANRVESTVVYVSQGIYIDEFPDADEHVECLNNQVRQHNGDQHADCLFSLSCLL